MAATTASIKPIVKAKFIMGWNKDDLIPIAPSCFSMKCIFWNCKGAANTDFKTTFSDMFRDHTTEIVVIMETKTPFSKMGNFFRNFWFFNSIVADPNRKVGGIW